MKTIRFKLYSIEILLIILLFFALFALNIEKRFTVLGILVIAFITSILILPKKKIYEWKDKKVEYKF